MSKYIRWSISLYIYIYIDWVPVSGNGFPIIFLAGKQTNFRYLLPNQGSTNTDRKIQPENHRQKEKVLRPFQFFVAFTAILKSSRLPSTPKPSGDWVNWVRWGNNLAQLGGALSLIVWFSYKRPKNKRREFYSVIEMGNLYFICKQILLSGSMPKIMVKIVSW